MKFTETEVIQFMNSDPGRNWNKKMAENRFPIPTVDIIIKIRDSIVLIERKNPPFGWAIPGGFVEKGESLEEAACREAKEETGLELEDLAQFHTYSAPGRDPRFHTISTVYTAKANGVPRGASDASKASLFKLNNLPERIAFDHRSILEDYMKNRY